MKRINKSALLFFIATITLFACNDEDYKLNTEIVEMGTLETPETDEHLNIDIENDVGVNFTWSPAKSGDGGLILYTVKFDEENGNFEDPIYEVPSDNGGSATSLTMSPTRLNIIAAEAGIEQLQTGNIIWTVEAASSFNTKSFPDKSVLSLTRPEGLAVFPDFMYIYGSATEAATMSEGVAFREITSQLPNENFQPGTFESVTRLTPGEFFIVNSNNPDSASTHYFINDEGKIRQGDEPSTFDMAEGVYRIRMNLSTATISFEEISDIELYIMANQVVKAELTYIGNHTFESTNGYFEFLTPGSPEAPDWLGWEEERYRFRFMVDGVQSYIGSFHNPDMNGSLVPGLNAYNARPNGEEPNYYHNTYFLGPDAEYWQGAWKFADQFNGAPFTVRIVFDPKADYYYHEFELN